MRNYIMEEKENENTRGKKGKEKKKERKIVALIWMKKKRNERE